MTSQTLAKQNPAIPARWILNAQNQAQSTTYTTEDGVERVAYNEGKTLADYLAEKPECRVVSETEFDEILSAHYESLKTKPSEITEETYYDLLNCLPPCRFDGNIFHISERMTGNLVQWCFKKNHKFYGFTDDASISADKLREIIGGA